jgi:hypothetical protein
MWYSWSDWDWWHKILKMNWKVILEGISRESARKLRIEIQRIVIYSAVKIIRHVSNNMTRTIEYIKTS